MQGITAAGSQHELAKANGKVDVTGSGNYSHVNGISAFTFSVSVPIPIFDRNQGEIAGQYYAMTQAQQQQQAARGQVMTDVRDAYEALQSSDRVAHTSGSGYPMCRRRTATSANTRTSAAPQACSIFWTPNAVIARLPAWRQTIAAYLTALEQVRQAVGTRSLP